MNTARTSDSFGPTWSQLAAEPGERCNWHYKDTPLKRSPHYEGPLDQLPEDQVTAVLREALRYFEVSEDLPSPPHSLPGALSHFDYQARRVASMGAKYLLGLLRGQTRTVWNAHDEIAEFIARIRREGERAQAKRAEHEESALVKSIRQRIDERDARPIYVYFIRAANGPIKIGIARDVLQRLAGLQTSNPNKLELLAHRLGDQSVEQEYHRRFAAHRLAGEWFEPHPDILEEATRLATHPTARSAQ